MFPIKILGVGTRFPDSLIDYRGIIIDRVTEGRAESIGAGMVVELLHRLMSIAGVKRHSFIGERIAIPISVATVLVGGFLISPS